MASARAAVLVEERRFELRELPLPEEPPPGGAIIRVVANGLCGSDYALYTGVLGRANPRRAPLPLVPGHEIVGRIERITPEAERDWKVSVGDRVAVEAAVRCGRCVDCQEGRGWHCPDLFLYSTVRVDMGSGLWGGLADHMVLVAGTNVVRIPDGVSDEDAALFNPIANAIHWASTIGEVGFGERVLVLGAGQRGVACCMLAKEAGAAQVIVTGLSRDAKKAELLREFGATDFVDVEQSDTVEAVRSLTDGRGVDLAVDTTPEAVAPVLHAIDCLRPQGRLVLAGVKGAAIDGFSSDKVYSRELQIRGAAGFTPRGLREAVRLIAEADYPFAALHSHRFGLDDVDLAVRILGSEVDGEEPFHITICP